MFTLKNSTRGFTLIELLVVITIIGILATGATTVYTSQIQKARDTTRISDIKALQSGIEQAYQDASVYPAMGVAFSGVAVYTPKFPKDPKTGQSTANTSLDYAYMAWPDANAIVGQQYELSTGFENVGTTTSKWGTDGGGDVYRFEAWINTVSNGTGLKGKQVLTSWASTPTSAPANWCVVPPAVTVGACTVANSVMVIR